MADARTPRARITPLHAAVRRLLRALATPATRAGAERYFRHVVRFHGVLAAEIRAVERAVWPRLAARPLAVIVATGVELCGAPYFEERQVGALLLRRVVRRLDAGSVSLLEPVFDHTVENWGTCDAIAGHVLRPLVARDPAALRRVVGWSRARAPWRRRAAAVALVAEARRGHHAREVLAVCTRLVRGEERFVQLGMGWVLRELWYPEPAQVEAFLATHGARIQREAMHCATEAMPVARRRRLLAEHARARGKGARGKAARGRRTE